MAEQYKRRRGDRKDGRLLRELDSLHYITGIIYPNRCDNEAYIGLRVDLTPINEYLKKKNEGEELFPYTMFHIITAALIKAITLRPKLNRFIANCNFYQRNEVTASFIVKKKFSDNGGESPLSMPRTAKHWTPCTSSFSRRSATAAARRRGIPPRIPWIS